jgi:hypothetical protein
MEAEGGRGRQMEADGGNLLKADGVPSFQWWMVADGGSLLKADGGKCFQRWMEVKGACRRWIEGGRKNRRRRDFA